MRISFKAYVLSWSLFLPVQLKDPNFYLKSEDIAMVEVLWPGKFQSVQIVRKPCVCLQPFCGRAPRLVLFHMVKMTCFSANALPLRKPEHLIHFKPFILTNIPRKLRSTEVRALINYVRCLLVWGLFSLFYLSKNYLKAGDL